MIKRIIFYSVILGLLLNFVYQVYQDYTPDTATVISTNPITYTFTNNYTFEEFEAYVTTTSEAVNVFFYQQDDVNSQYFFNITLPAIMADNNVSELEGVIYVDISDLTEDSVAVRSRYCITSIPSLVNLTYADSTITINSYLSTNNSTFDSASIEDWLASNNIITLVEDEETTTEETTTTEEQ